MNQNCWSWRGRGTHLHILHLTHNYKLQKKYLYMFLQMHILHIFLHLSQNWILDSEQGWCCGNWLLSAFGKSKWRQKFSFKVSEDAHSNISYQNKNSKCFSQICRKSEQVSSQMQMWIPLQENVTWSAARHKRKEEKRERGHLHFFSCRIMWVGGWVREGVTDPDLLVFVFVLGPMPPSGRRT